ncbi:Cupin domain-containing protein [Balamuthia mandrillaris]
MASPAAALLAQKSDAEGPLTAEAVVELLGMQPHPEGGYYVEVFRSEDDGGSMRRDKEDETPSNKRAAVSSIYFLLRGKQISRWHKIDAVEIWNWYAGAPLRLSISAAPKPTQEEGAGTQHILLGADLAHGQRPQGIVPRHAWQQAECLAETGDGWTLVGCIVAPAFVFSEFVMLPVEDEEEEKEKKKNNNNT